MNFLAHSYLSFGYREVLVGNMISDFVKGRKQYDFSADIQKGIRLHRDIDGFTDDHEATREAKAFLKPAVALYAGAFIDVVYDHFLANDTNEFADATLQVHASKTYEVLEKYQDVLPPRFSQMLPFMITQNWLYHYRSLWGTQNSFGGLARRAKYLHSADEAFCLFQQNYGQLQNCYNAFFPGVKAFARGRLQELSG